MRFRAIWPVLEPRPLHDHVAEARDDLPRLLMLSRARLLGGVCAVCNATYAGSTEEPAP